MKTPNSELRALLYNRLNSAIVYNTRTIPVNSVPPSNQSFSYILIGAISLTDNSVKDTFQTIANIDITVVHQIHDQTANYAEIEAVSSDLVNKIVDYRTDTANFEIVYARFKSSYEQEEISDVNKTLTNKITFEFYITEL